MATTMSSLVDIGGSTLAVQDDDDEGGEFYGEVEQIVKQRMLEEGDLEEMPQDEEIAYPAFTLAPVGWRIVIRPYEIRQTFKDSKILKAAETMRAEEYLTNIGEVIAVGPLAYKDERFKNERWCRRGDMVMYPRHAGQEAWQVVNGKRVRLRVINDDEILGTIDDAEKMVTPI